MGAVWLFLKLTLGFHFSFLSAKLHEFPLQFCIQNVLLTVIIVRAFRIIILSLPAKSDLEVPGLGRTVVVSVFSLVQSVTNDLQRSCFYKMCLYVYLGMCMHIIHKSRWAEDLLLFNIASDL